MLNISHLLSYMNTEVDGKHTFTNVRKRRVTVGSFPSFSKIVNSFQGINRSKIPQNISTGNLSEIAEDVHLKNGYETKLSSSRSFAVESSFMQKSSAWSNLKQGKASSECFLNDKFSSVSDINSNSRISKSDTLPPCFKIVSPIKLSKPKSLSRVESIDKHCKKAGSEPSPNSYPHSDTGFSSPSTPLENFKISTPGEELEKGRSHSYTSGFGMPKQRNIDQIKQKILKTNELIHKERTLQEEDVAEYLRLCFSADKQQAMRIKTVFDKKYEKSNTAIEKLQRKVDLYTSKLKEIESRKKVVYVDDLFTLPRHSDDSTIEKSQFSQRINKENVPSSKTSGILNEDKSNVILDMVSAESDAKSVSPSVSVETLLENISSNSRRKKNTSELLASISVQLQCIRMEIQEMYVSQKRLEKQIRSRRDDIKSCLLRQLDEDSIRREEKLNDFADIHQKEMSSLKMELSSMEDKLEYNAVERARDIQELLENCQARITSIELHQQRHETLDTSGNPDNLAGKLINVVISMLALLFVVISTVNGFINPFVKSWLRLFLTTSVLAFGVLVYFDMEIFTSINWKMLISNSAEAIRNKTFKSVK